MPCSGELKGKARPHPSVRHRPPHRRARDQACPIRRAPPFPLRPPVLLEEPADVSPAATAAALTAAVKSAMFTDGKTLDALLTTEEFQLVSKAVDKAGIPGALARVYRPWIVTNAHRRVGLRAHQGPEYRQRPRYGHFRTGQGARQAKWQASRPSSSSSKPCPRSRRSADRNAGG